MSTICAGLRTEKPTDLRAAGVLVCAVLMLTTAACEPASQPEAKVTTPPVGEPSPSASPMSDVVLETHRVTSIDDVLAVLEQIDWEQVLVFERGTPARLQVWESGGHLHARVDYGRPGLKLSLIQAEGEGLPPGQLVRVRGLDGIRSDGGLYWIERDFVIALSPGRKTLAAALTWLRT